MINICEQALIKYLKTNTMCSRPKSTQNTKQNKVHDLILAVFMLIRDKSATGDKKKKNKSVLDCHLVRKYEKDNIFAPTLNPLLSPGCTNLFG